MHVRIRPHADRRCVSTQMSQLEHVTHFMRPSVSVLSLGARVCSSRLVTREGCHPLRYPSARVVREGHVGEVILAN